MEADGLAAGREEERASLARQQERAQEEAAAAAQPTRESSAATAAMVNLVAILGQELAEVLQDVPACDLYASRSTGLRSCSRSPSGWC